MEAAGLLVMESPDKDSEQPDVSGLSRIVDFRYHMSERQCPHLPNLVSRYTRRDHSGVGGNAGAAKRTGGQRLPAIPALRQAESVRLKRLRLLLRLAAEAHGDFARSYLSLMECELNSRTDNGKAVDYAAEVRPVDSPVLKQSHAVSAMPSRTTCEIQPGLRGEAR